MVKLLVFVIKKVKLLTLGHSYFVVYQTYKMFCLNATSSLTTSKFYKLNKLHNTLLKFL